MHSGYYAPLVPSPKSKWEDLNEKILNGQRELREMEERQRWLMSGQARKAAYKVVNSSVKEDFGTENMSGIKSAASLPEIPNLRFNSAKKSSICTATSAGGYSLPPVRGAPSPTSTSSNKSSTPMVRLR